MNSPGQDSQHRIVSSQSIYEGRVFDLRVDDIEFAPGHVLRRDVIVHPGAVVIIPVDNEGRILWVAQYRYAAGMTLLELPAGTLEDGENPEACARRELIEEVGFQAHAWQTLGGFYSAPGFCTEYLHAFAATELMEAYADGDEDEEIEVLPLTPEETLQRMDSGEIRDAKSLATFLLYQRLGK